MADDTKSGYPTMSVAAWKAIRSRLKTSIPGTLTPETLAAWFDNMNPTSAKKNLVPSLRAVGLIDAQGRVNTGLASRVRDDAQYVSVCKEILETVYPKELRDAFSDPADQAGIKRWFMNHTHAGDSMANKVTYFYSMLLKADPTGAKEPAKSTGAAAGRRSSRREQVQTGRVKEPAQVGSGSPQPPVNMVNTSPPLHINVQIHISAEAPPEQVELIFASMAKHLRNWSA